jgi:hypothetical protein
MTNQLREAILGNNPDWIWDLDPKGRHLLTATVASKGKRVQVRASLKMEGTNEPLVRYIYLIYDALFEMEPLV